MVAKLEIINSTNARTAVIRLYTSANKFEEVDAAVERVKLSSSDRNKGVIIAAQMTAQLQAQHDVRLLLSSLPKDDPNRTIDPARGDIFWQDIDGDQYLVSRECVVEVIWDEFDGVEQYNASWILAKP